MIGNLIINYVLYRQLTRYAVSDFFSIMKYVLIPYTITFIIPLSEIGYIVANMNISKMLYGAPRPEEVQLLNTTITYATITYIAYILAATITHYTIIRRKISLK